LKSTTGEDDAMITIEKRRCGVLNMPLALPDYVRHPDHGSVAASVLYVMRKRAKRLGWLVCSLASATALVVTWAMVAGTDGRLQQAATLSFSTVLFAFCLVWTLLAVNYSDYRAIKRLAKLENELVASMRSAFQMVSQSLIDLDGTQHGREAASSGEIAEHGARISEYFGKKQSEASIAGRPVDAQSMVSWAVQACAETLHVKPAISDIWFKFYNKGRQSESFWWCPDTLPYVSPDLQDAIKDVRMVREDLRPRALTGMSEEILTSKHPRIVTGRQLGKGTRALEIKACIGVPIVVDDEARGILWLRYMHEVHGIDEPALEALMEFCGRLGRAASSVHTMWERLIGELSRQALRDAFGACLAEPTPSSPAGANRR
jgi:hypothetical protein